MEILAKIRTQFVQARIAETSWANRSYISHLYLLEQLVFNNGPHSVAEGMALKSLTSRYPVEYRCIEKEILEGVLTQTKEFGELQQEFQREKLATERQQVRRQLKQKERELALWQQAGGR